MYRVLHECYASSYVDDIKTAKYVSVMYVNIT